MNWKPNSKPRRLMPPWMWVGLVMVFLVGITWFFPRASLFQQLIHHESDEEIDSVRVLLLQALLQKGIQGFSLHREYIRQLALMKNFPAAFAELDRLGSKWEGKNRDSLWILEMELACWALSSPAKSPIPMEDVQNRLHSTSEALINQGGPASLQWAQGQLLAIGLYDQAARIQLKLSEIDSTPKYWQRKAAASFSLAGDCDKAAKLMMVIYDQSLSMKEQRSLFLQTLKILQACDRLDQAVQVTKSKIRDWRDDTDILLKAVELARAANQPKVAEQFAQMLVRPLAVAPEP